MYPLLLNIPGHLHIFYNALREAVESMDGCKDFLDQLRHVEDFLSAKFMRRAFQARCFYDAAERKLFNYFSTVHINWKWEFLTRALKPLVPLLPTMTKRFDTTLLLEASSNVTEKGTIMTVGAILANNPSFAAICELVRIVAAVVEKYAGKLEGCWCHEEVWAQKTGYKRKRQQFVAQTGHNFCVWKGRMAPWFVAVGIRQMVSDISNSGSELLTSILDDMTEGVRSGLLIKLHQMKSRLIKALLAKLKLWDHIPYKALGIFWCMCGGDVETCKRILRECLLEFDTAIAMGTRFTGWLSGSLRKTVHAGSSWACGWSPITL